ncbi:MAG TPA: PDZ domain-containing protein, partial [Pyrinomonadaceae bacterium]|nr:PDZ domain-containing protein [Pyrinomonadaceae bacterium]
AGNEQEVAVKLGRREHQMPRAFAIPQLSDEQRRQLEDLGRRGGSFNMVIGAQRRIGVTTAELTTQLADYFGVPGGHGLLVTSVADNSPAARAGIKAGDVITAVDGSAVEDSMDLISAVNRQSSGDVTLTIIRERNQRTIKVTPEQRRAGDFELHEITPQVGQINIPPMNIQLPRVNFVSPQMNLHMPRIVIPPMPRIEMTVPRIMRLPGMGVM